uniref:Uncharacterized protein n=1 Tax=uncultured virus TaxID=340016 RepID=D5L2H8_9VIRU|nr:hypothetical protein [uncultured virus]
MVHSLFLLNHRKQATEAIWMLGTGFEPVSSARKAKMRSAPHPTATDACSGHLRCDGLISVIQLRYDVWVVIKMVRPWPVANVG